MILSTIFAEPKMFPNVQHIFGGEWSAPLPPQSTLCHPLEHLKFPPFSQPHSLLCPQTQTGLLRLFIPVVCGFFSSNVFLPLNFQKICFDYSTLWRNTFFRNYIFWLMFITLCEFHFLWDVSVSIVHSSFLSSFSTARVCYTISQIVNSLRKLKWKQEWLHSVCVLALVLGRFPASVSNTRIYLFSCSPAVIVPRLASHLRWF